jgi:hypothetical protein
MFIEENTVDLHCMGGVVAAIVGGVKHTDPVKNINLYKCIMILNFSFVGYICVVHSEMFLNLMYLLRC